MTSQHTRRTRTLLSSGLARSVGLVLVLCTASSAWALEDLRLRTRALAATCAQCHGTDGHAVAGEPLVKLAGLPRQHLLTQLMAFRTGQRPATIMHQITRGYSQEQLEELSTYFAAQP